VKAQALSVSGHCQWRLDLQDARMEEEVWYTVTGQPGGRDDLDKRTASTFREHGMPGGLDGVVGGIYHSVGSSCEILGMSCWKSIG
jgi:hypothetical protein